MSRWASFEINATLYCIKNYIQPKESRKLVLQPPNNKGDADAEFHCDTDKIFFLQLKSRISLSQVTVNTPALKAALQQLFDKFLNFYPPPDSCKREFIAVIEGYGDDIIQKLHYSHDEPRDYLAIAKLENTIWDSLSSALEQKSQSEIDQLKSAFFNHLYIIDTPKLEDLMKELRSQYGSKYDKIIESLGNPPHTVIDIGLLTEIAAIPDLSPLLSPENSKENRETSGQIQYISYCCGRPMIVTRKGNYIIFKCATGSHKRWFKISEDSSQNSLCSCHSGGAKMETANLGSVRLCSCPRCGARYSVFIKGNKFETQVEGESAEEVARVGEQFISSLWDRLWNSDTYERDNNSDEFFEQDVQKLKKIINNSN